MNVSHHDSNSSSILKLSHNFAELVDRVSQGPYDETKKEEAEDEIPPDQLSPRQEELEAAAAKGNFPSRPSELFLRIYHDVMSALEAKPKSGVVTPSLAGTNGVVTHTVLGSIPEIMSYCSKISATAEHELIIVTAYWEKGDSVDKIHDAIMILNNKVQEARAIDPNRPNIVVKILYDRAHFIRKAFTPSFRVEVKPDEWPKIDLPKKEEIPFVDLEVLDYHRPFVGTFHAKFIIVDRKVAFLMSNNIQDRPNLEMCVQLEGHIVDSIYDSFLISWKNSMTPTLPLLNVAAPVDNFTWDEPNIDNFTEYHAYLNHKPHQPIPMVLVNRRPHGAPGHKDIINPQDAAWLGAFRYAKKSIFIVTPTFNARPAVHGILSACKRGVSVVLVCTMGFDDKGESLPFQGGTNAHVIEKLVKNVKKHNREDLFKAYWYVGDGQTEARKGVHCHAKFMTVDDQIVIFGNGNMDTQSWFHSEEINIMVDSQELCSEWMKLYRRNMQTFNLPPLDF